MSVTNAEAHHWAVECPHHGIWRELVDQVRSIFTGARRAAPVLTSSPDSAPDAIDTPTLLNTYCMCLDAFQNAPDVIDTGLNPDKVMLAEWLQSTTNDLKRRGVSFPRH